jgi:ribosomal protein L23
MFRWGILSTARIGREQVIPQLQDSENGVVTAIASRDHARARALADRFGAPLAFWSYEDLLASDQVDGVYIPLPTSQHIEWSIRAAQAGKHVLCEKPIALHADEITPLIVTRDANKVLVCEAFMVTYHPQWRKVRELIADGAIGRLRHVQGAFSYFNIDPDNMRNQPDLGGGGLPDIGVYPTVSTRFSTGREPLRVQAVVERDPGFRHRHLRQRQGGFRRFRNELLLLDPDGAQAIDGVPRREGLHRGDSAPFNAGDYGHAAITLHNADHEQAQISGFPASGNTGFRPRPLSARCKAGKTRSSPWSSRCSTRNSSTRSTARRHMTAGRRFRVQASRWRSWP